MVDLENEEQKQNVDNEMRGGSQEHDGQRALALHYMP